jgi:hypothetical protein
MIEILQAMQIVQVPENGCVLAVDLECIQRLVAARIAGRLERGQRSVVEARQERAGVVDAHFLHAAGQRMLALLDERFGHGGDPSIPPFSHMAVSMQCASRSPVTPLPATFTSSRHRPAPPLRQVGRDRPVLEELRPVMEDLAQPAFVDQLLGQRHGGDAAVVVPDHVRHAGLSTAATMRSDSAALSAQRLLAEDHLAGLRRRDGDLRVRSLGLAMSIRSISVRSTSLRQSVSTTA